MSEWQALSICLKSQRPTHLNQRRLQVRTLANISQNFTTDKAIYMDLGYSESEFYRMLSRGALEFAEAYRKGKLIVYRKILGDICK